MGDTNSLYPNRRDPNATVWDDIQSSLLGRRLYSTVGIVDYDYTENAIVFGDGGDITDLNDRIGWNVQFPHAAKLGTSIYPHLHFWQDRSDNVEFTLRYRVQSNNSAKVTSWTVLTADFNNNLAFSYSSGTLNQIISFGAISMSGATISSTIQFQLTRTDNLGGTVSVTFADIHVEMDSFGSRQEFIK